MTGRLKIKWMKLHCKEKLFISEQQVHDEMTTYDVVGCPCCLIAVDISISRKKMNLLFQCSHTHEPQHNRNRLRPRKWKSLDNNLYLNSKTSLDHQIRVKLKMEKTEVVQNDEEMTHLNHIFTLNLN